MALQIRNRRVVQLAKDTIATLQIYWRLLGLLTPASISALAGIPGLKNLTAVIPGLKNLTVVPEIKPLPMQITLKNLTTRPSMKTVR